MHLYQGCSFSSKEIKYYETACTIASSNNQFECFKFSEINGCDIQWSLIIASRYGNLKILKYVYEKYYKSNEDIDYQERFS